MNSEIKKGDRVRITAVVSDNGIVRRLNGNEATVIRYLDDGEEFPYVLDVDASVADFAFRRNELVKITPKPKRNSL